MKKGQKFIDAVGEGILGEILWPLMLVFLLVVGLRDKFSRKNTKK